MIITSIEEYLSTFLSWEPVKRNSNNLVGLCPFHNEQVPSFSIVTPSADPATHYFRCHALHCGVAGRGLYGIVRVHEFGGVDRKAEIRARCNELEGKGVEGVTHEEKPIFDQVHESGREPTSEEIEVMTVACEWWIRAFYGYGQRAKDARTYLQGRGVDLDYARQVRTVGYAPYISPSYSTYTSFLKKLAECGPRWKEIAQDLGIINLNERVSFQHRMVFMQRDEKGKIISFQGRTLQEDYQEKKTPKFLMPHGLKKPVYTLPVAHPLLQGSVLLESYVGVLALTQRRIETGAQLGENTVIALEDWSWPVYLAQDGDPLKWSSRLAAFVRAGDELAKKHMAYAIEHNIPAYRVPIPLVDKDPDTVLLQRGFTAWLDLMAEARSESALALAI